MAIFISDFGVLQSGEIVKKIKIKNKNGMEVSVITFGAAITQLLIETTKHGIVDVVLGYEKLEDYVNGNDAFGAVVGRHANRIKNAQFCIDGETFTVTANSGKHSLHSGDSNLVKKNFNYSIVDEQTARFIGFSYDGEEGFPGNVEFTVEYTLTEENQLILKYYATTDQATPINITNHSFFNLNGHQSGTAMNHFLVIDSDKMTLNDVDSVPTGEITDVSDTPFDFRKGNIINAHINDSNDQLNYGLGYDQNYVLNQSVPYNLNGKIYFAAQLIGNITGIIMNNYTTQPGLQLYTANHLKNGTSGKSKATYGWRHGICLETQRFPASLSYPNFPSVILRPKKEFHEISIYEFK